jgi:hypothetical protein
MVAGARSNQRMACAHRLPRFRVSCVVIGVLYVLLGASVLVRGGASSLAEFGVPAATLASPHYGDAIWWVYSHMIVIGLMTGVVGWFARGVELKRWFVRLMFLTQVYYVVLDVRASDSPLGSGLYEGPASIVPAVIGAFVMLVFAHLSICRTARE